MKKLGLTGSKPKAANAKEESSTVASKRRAITKTEKTEEGDVDQDQVEGEAEEETVESPRKKAKTSA